MAQLDDDAIDIARPSGGPTDENTRASDQDDGPLDDLDVQRIVHAALVDAVLYTDQQLSPDRAKKTDYYFSRPFGNEEDGRSQIVSSDVRDSVMSVLPSVLRVIFGPERAVEFVPSRADYVEQAKQESDYVQYVFEEEQDGFLKTHSVLKDGLIRGAGVFKWWWEPEVARVYTMENLTQDQIVMLQMQPGVEVMRVTPRAMPRRWGITKIKQAVGMAEPDVQTYDVEVKEIDEDGHPVIDTVPPEEFVSSRQSRGLDNALCIGHRTEKTRSELVQMGISIEDIEEWGEFSGDLLFANPEEIARRDGMTARDPRAGKANDKILYCEAYIPLDVDGDGIAELRRCCTVGPSYHVVYHEPVTSIPMSFFCPDPEPHVIYGQAWSDRTMDIQYMKSSLWRAINDSAAFSIFPRMGVVEGKASMADVLNTEIGAPIRMDAPGMVQPFAVPFIGGEMLPLLTYSDDVVERRTGRNEGAAGLDADALQSTTAGAVQAVVQGSQDQIELLVRIFCEQALKPMFEGVRELFIQHQPRKKTIALRGKWVEVDPKTWDAKATARVNVALGNTMTTGRQQALAMILAKQEQILSMLGLGQPIVTPQQYANTLRALVATFGIKDIDSYFGTVPANWQPPPPPQAPSEQQTMLQIEQMKTQKDLQIKQAELQLKQQQQAIDADLANKKLAVDAELRRYAIAAQFKVDMTEQQLEADSTQMEHWLDAHGQGHEQALAENQQQHEQQMAEQEQAAAEQQAQAQQSQQGEGQ